MTTLQQITAGTGADARVNENFQQTSPAALYAKDPVTSVGLTWGYKGGQYGSTTVADGTVALAASTINYVVALRSTGVVSTSTATTNWNDATNYMRLYSVVAGASTVTSSVDYRQVVGLSAIFTGGTLITPLNEAPAVTLASAATVDIGAAAANTVNISGTTTITSFGTIAAGATRRVVFQGALTLTYNAASMILPGGANLTTAAGDTAEMLSLGAGNWRCVSYQLASGYARAAGSPTQDFAAANFNAAGNFTVTGSGKRLLADFSDLTLANRFTLQSSVANALTEPFFLPNGTSPTAGVGAINNSNPINASFCDLIIDGTRVRLRSSVLGTGTYLPLILQAGGYSSVTMDTSGNTAVGGNLSVTGVANVIPPEAVVAPTLLASWVNSGGSDQTAGYWKSPDGIVHFRAKIKSGTITGGTVILNFGAGYRPTALETFVADGNGAHAVCSVSITGDLAIVSGFSATATSISIQFRAA